jgi:YD repeat-containing protein
MCQDNLVDKTLEQETWYGYDAAGRLTNEYIKDDNGRTAAQVYEWTKNGALQKTTLPSTVVLGATFGSTGRNSDTDKIAALWRGYTATPIADQILWEPYGPLKQYNQQNTSSTQPLRTVITRNLAYRITKTEVEVQSAPSSDLHYVIVDEDAAGRTKKRIYFPSPSAVQDSWFMYDQQDRVTCEATSNPGSSCPTSSTVKNNHSGSGPFTAAGDWKTLLRPIPGSSGLTHSFSLNSGTHQIASVNQSEGTPTLGTTAFTYNSLGNRLSDDNAGSSTQHDPRDYTYDAQHNGVNVHGQYYTGSASHQYEELKSVR